MRIWPPAILFLFTLSYSICFCLYFQLQPGSLMLFTMISTSIFCLLFTYQKLPLYFSVFTAIFAIYLWIAPKSYIQDIRGGRQGLLVYPCFVLYKKGENTDLLEMYLGKLDPHWHHLNYRMNDWFLGITDGQEEVNSVSIIRKTYLEKTLRQLPNEEAKKQVFREI